MQDTCITCTFTSLAHNVSILAHILSPIRCLPSYYYMAKRKRSRIVNSLDTLQPSLATLPPTCTDVIARRLAQAHTVTLRSSTNQQSDRPTNRQTQRFLHTEVEQDTTLLLDSGSQHSDDNAKDIEMDTHSQVESDDDVPDIPKRPAVSSCNVFSYFKLILIHSFA